MRKLQKVKSIYVQIRCFISISESINQVMTRFF